MNILFNIAHNDLWYIRGVYNSNFGSGKKVGIDYLSVQE